MQHNEFLKSTVRVWENLEASVEPKKQIECQRVEHSRNKDERKPKATYAASLFKAKPKSNCLLCPSEHYMLFCPKFKATAVEERINIVEKYHLCYNCLGPHRVADCKTAQGCRKCGQRHYICIHLDAPLKPASPQPTVPHKVTNRSFRPLTT